MRTEPLPDFRPCPDCELRRSCSAARHCARLPRDEAAADPQPHRQRVVAELAELSARRSRLVAFVDGMVWGQLPMAERDRLRRQLRAMKEYEAVLQERVAAFDQGEKT